MPAERHAVTDRVSADYLRPEAGDRRVIVGHLTVELVRGLFTDTVRTWTGGRPTWPGLLFGGLTIRYCRHRHGPTLFVVILGMATAVEQHLPDVAHAPLPDSRRGLNRLLAQIEQQSGVMA